MRRPELYVWDWDGTVMDTTGLIARGIQHACVEMGYEAPSLDVARSSIGLNLYDTLELVCPQMPYGKADDYLKAYRGWYLCREAEIGVVDGLEEMMRSMKTAGCRMAVATGKSRRGLDRVLEKTGLGDIFEATVTVDDGYSKPNPGLLGLLEDETGVVVADMIMVGDSTHDLQLAANAGCSAIGVTWGAARRRELAALPHVALCDTLEELKSALSFDAICGR